MLKRNELSNKAKSIVLWNTYMSYLTFKEDKPLETGCVTKACLMKFQATHTQKKVKSSQTVGGVFTVCQQETFTLWCIWKGASWRPWLPIPHENGGWLCSSLAIHTSHQLCMWATASPSPTAISSLPRLDSHLCSLCHETHTRCLSVGPHDMSSAHIPLLSQAAGADYQGCHPLWPVVSHKDHECESSVWGRRKALLEEWLPASLTLRKLAKPIDEVAFWWVCSSLQPVYQNLSNYSFILALNLFVANWTFHSVMTS